MTIQNTVFADVRRKTAESMTDVSPEVAERLAAREHSDFILQILVDRDIPLPFSG